MPSISKSTCSTFPLIFSKRKQGSIRAKSFVALRVVISSTALLLLWTFQTTTNAQAISSTTKLSAADSAVESVDRTKLANDSKKKILGAKRIVFLGDSNTHAGEWINQIETALLSTQASVPEMINLGLPSETCSGFSEPAHPFPRPNVQERLSRALEKTKPDLIFACYGMNDGIYHPFAEERFKGFQAGIQKIVDATAAADIPLILITPPPFDALPMRKAGGLVPLDAKEFLWTKIYENYDDEVIQKYAQWMLTVNKPNCLVIDVHTPIKEYLADRRKTEPDFAFSKDGVHFDNAGHKVFAAVVLKSLNFDEALEHGEPKQNDAVLQLVRQRRKIQHLAWLTEVGHLRPGVQAGLPIDKANEKTKDISEKIDSMTQ